MTTESTLNRANLLVHASDVLEPDEARIALAHKRYESVGDAVKESGGRLIKDVEMFSQGSYRLGTTTQNPDTLEFDIDAVISVDYTRENVSQQELNDRVGGWLYQYVDSQQSARSDLGIPTLTPGKRAWTLQWDDSFHIDVLPVIPATAIEIASTYGPAHWLTDKELTRWQPTHPRGFAGWFDDVIHADRVELAKMRAVTVEELPRHGKSRTVLQRAIQLMKRHRDEWNGCAEGDRPPSVIITALATSAYADVRPTGDLLAVMTAIARRMPALVDVRSNPPQICNPTCPAENYADRFADRPERTAALLAWLDELNGDLTALAAARGGDVYESFGKSFGVDFGAQAVKRMAGSVSSARETGSLYTAGTGALGFAPTSGQRHNEKHDFYGR